MEDLMSGRGTQFDAVGSQSASSIPHLADALPDGVRRTEQPGRFAGTAAHG
jgi:hypothetical protein